MGKRGSEIRKYVKAFGVMEVILWICAILAPPLATLYYHFIPNSLMWILYISIYVPVFGVHIWASIQLVKATEPGREINDAYKRCRYWRNTTIAIDTLIILVPVIYNIYNITVGSEVYVPNSPSNSFFFVLRCLTYFVGGLFLRELKANIESDKNQTDLRV